ncbi:unnamed protein product [Sphagnum balticum]
MAGPAGAGGGSAQKRGRPPNNPNSGGGGGGGGGAAAAAAGASAAAEAMAVGGVAQASVVPSLGPTLQVHSNFAEQHNKRIVMALQSGLKGELSWAINALTVLSFKEKDDARKDAPPLAKVPGLLDALLHVIHEWRDIAHERVFAHLSRPRVLGADQPFSGFGFEYEITSPDDPLWRLRSVNVGSVQTDKQQQQKWCWDEEGLFNLDEIGRHERQQCAVAVSNVLRNLSFMPENEVTVAQHRRCLETLVQCMEDHETEDEELVTNAVETVLNLSPYLCLKIFADRPTANGNAQRSITEKRAVQAFMTMLESPVRVWHCSAAELLGRLVVNPDNEPFLLPHAPQIYRRLVELLGMPTADAQAAAVAALYNFAEINTDCRLSLASERWAIGRLLRVVQTPHAVQEVCRKAALTLESLASEPQNRVLMSSYESMFAELAVTDQRMSDIFARILWELSSGANSKMGSVRGVWGSS